MRVRFVSNAGVVAPATTVGVTGVDSAAGFPVMAAHANYLYVGYRDSSAQLRVKRGRAAALPRGTAPVPSASAESSGPEVGAALPAGAELLAEDDSRVALNALVNRAAQNDTESQATGGITRASVETPLVVAFFARWCQPCREEMQALEALRVAHPNWTILAVSVDEGPARRAESVARSWGFEGRVLRDGGAAARLGVPPLPGTFAWTGPALAFVSVGELFSPAALEEAIAPE